jgi:hypothetical protein
MTTPSGAGGRVPGSALPLRTLTAWTLLALAGLLILFGFLHWILPAREMDLLARFATGRFTSLPVLVAPLLAVLVAARLGPPIPRATLVGLVALIEYAVALVLGVLAFLVTLALQFDDLGHGIYLLGGIVQRIGDILVTLLQLALLALAGLWTHRIFAGLGGRLPGLDPRT